MKINTIKKPKTIKSNTTTRKQYDFPKVNIPRKSKSKQSQSITKFNDIKLSGALMNDGLPILNQYLALKCPDQKYTLGLQQFRYHGKDDAIYEHNTGYNIILCLYNSKKKCVASVIGKYHEHDRSIEISSKTSTEYEGRKFNIFLRASFIYLMSFVRSPKIKSVISMSVNPISTYTMYKYFKVSCPDLESFLEKNKLSSDKFNLEHAKQFHIYYANKHKQTLESAQEMLDEMLEFSDLEELGFDSNEEGLEFIMSTMNPTAITLILDLERQGLRENMLKKKKKISVVCASK